eukprot:SAG31_NODE_532_length_14374_cov_30.565254_14_plen_158_part_00
MNALKLPAMASEIGTCQLSTSSPDATWLSVLCLAVQAKQPVVPVASKFSSVDHQNRALIRNSCAPAAASPSAVAAHSTERSLPVVSEQHQMEQRKNEALDHRVNVYFAYPKMPQHVDCRARKAQLGVSLSETIWRQHNVYLVLRQTALGMVSVCIRW